MVLGKRIHYLSLQHINFCCSESQESIGTPENLKRFAFQHFGKKKKKEIFSILFCLSRLSNAFGMSSSKLYFPRKL